MDNIQTLRNIRILSFSFLIGVLLLHTRDSYRELFFLHVWSNEIALFWEFSTLFLALMLLVSCWKKWAEYGSLAIVFLSTIVVEMEIFVRSYQVFTQRDQLSPLWPFIGMVVLFILTFALVKEWQVLAKAHGMALLGALFLSVAVFGVGLI